MASNVKIAHPKTGNTLQWPGVPVQFVAFGQAPPQSNISARLKDRTGQMIGSPKLLKGSPNWVVLFADVPTGGDYVLEVLDGPAVVASSKDLNVVGAVFGIEIAYPEAHSTVCPTFAAYGKTDSGGTVTASLIFGTTAVAGVTLQNGPVWVVQFTNVKERDYDQLKAQAGSTSIATIDKVTTNQGACGI